VGRQVEQATRPARPVAAVGSAATRHVASARGGAFSSAFPGELEIAMDYDVTRHTVREALRRLREAGVLDSAHGRPTPGLGRDRAAARQPLLALPRDREPRHGPDERDPRPVDHDGHAQCRGARAGPRNAPVSPRARPARRRRSTGARPGLAARGGRTPAHGGGLPRTALHEEFARRCGVRVTGGTERISATVPAPAERALLAVPYGIACLVVERAGHAGADLVERRVHRRPWRPVVGRRGLDGPRLVRQRRDRSPVNTAGCRVSVRRAP